MEGDAVRGAALVLLLEEGLVELVALGRMEVLIDWEEEVEEDRELGIVDVELLLGREVDTVMVPMVVVEVIEGGEALDTEEGTGKEEVREAIWVGEEPDMPSSLEGH
ncbi:hypothetical protein GLOTRDRAFT_132616 [Gloeophyllum trabeum ATCC 11539]|uniref:Uncharacterized protein n=1 Tax=Gloeophyllum trabeum (strain ATCC 11539 / FP-39264 / Madison 617) TaxID=670483 RepID=S7PWA5_GLOTA|nr:uncharacterized protein GLOTRDRAFT_132616 [Gloeophyllum trabeum ATCC 11539]EPQ51803.1 hypothetical protein GLOTRDRAFT_132616 [Gloeophyllum trabeum ATCC 11539]